MLYYLCTGNGGLKMAKTITLKYEGKCADCGCGMCRIMSKADADKAVSAGEAKKAA